MHIFNHDLCALLKESPFSVEFDSVLVVKQFNLKMPYIFYEKLIIDILV